MIVIESSRLIYKCFESSFHNESIIFIKVYVFYARHNREL